MRSFALVRTEGWSYRREISHISHFWPTCPDVAQVECEIFVKFTRGNLRPPIAVSQKFHTSSVVTRWLLQAEFRECVPVVDSCRICTRGVILESVLRYLCPTSDFLVAEINILLTLVLCVISSER